MTLSSQIMNILIINLYINKNKSLTTLELYEDLLKILQYSMLVNCCNCYFKFSKMDWIEK